MGTGEVATASERLALGELRGRHRYEQTPAGASWRWMAAALLGAVAVFEGLGAALGDDADAVGTVVSLVVMVTLVTAAVLVVTRTGPRIYLFDRGLVAATVFDRVTLAQRYGDIAGAELSISRPTVRLALAPRFGDRHHHRIVFADGTELTFTHLGGEQARIALDDQLAALATPEGG